MDNQADFGNPAARLAVGATATSEIPSFSGNLSGYFDGSRGWGSASLYGFIDGFTFTQ